MTPRNFTCIAKGHFLLEFVMYLCLSTTDYIHSSSDCQIIITLCPPYKVRTTYINYSSLGEKLLLFNLQCPSVSQTFQLVIIFLLTNTIPPFFKIKSAYIKIIIKNDVSFLTPFFYIFYH